MILSLGAGERALPHVLADRVEWFGGALSGGPDQVDRARWLGGAT
ncbi:MAG TPA: hypothetical protein VN408_07855 [Actinoplanes sp.]|nr:hypothetical protein [Actinoplanes sp.]